VSFSNSEIAVSVDVLLASLRAALLSLPDCAADAPDLPRTWASINGSGVKDVKRSRGWGLLCHGMIFIHLDRLMVVANLHKQSLDLARGMTGLQVQKQRTCAGALGSTE
jgi:hypothetical protein